MELERYGGGAAVFNNVELCVRLFDVVGELPKVGC